MTIDELIQNFHLQKEAVTKLIEKYDEDFSNKKLNPYGVTTIEFQQRSDAYSQKSRLEGAIDALYIVKRDIMGDDEDVPIPAFELNIEDGNIEMEIIGSTSNSTIDDDVPGDPSY
jgi:DNA/RNA endonuclease YhcR with UshA esterase domain